MSPGLITVVLIVLVVSIVQPHCEGQPSTALGKVLVPVIVLVGMQGLHIERMVCIWQRHTGTDILQMICLEKQFVLRVIG